MYVYTLSLAHGADQQDFLADCAKWIVQVVLDDIASLVEPVLEPYADKSGLSIGVGLEGDLQGEDVASRLGQLVSFSNWLFSDRFGKVSFDLNFFLLSFVVVIVLVNKNNGVRGGGR